jgi:amino acid transporter
MSETSPRGGEGPELRRALGLWLVVSYGLGVTIGAGIYVLVGEAAARAGDHAPISFLLAAVVMAFSAASFAELASRFPVSAGEAAYVEAGLKSKWLALGIGLLVVAAAVISAAAISRGAAGYVGVFIPAPSAVLTAGVVLAMGAFAAWGITQAVGLAAVMTLIEVTGLAAVIAAGVWKNPTLLADLPLAWSGLDVWAPWPGILGASLIAFFAFIGFEGMVNVAEEVRRPERTLPLAIAITLVLSTLLYILVVWVVIRSVPATELAASTAPLSLAFERLTHASPLVISAIAVFATINGVIVQMLMASRVIYGLARQGNLPARLGAVNPRTQTPLLATGLVTVVILALALAVPLDRLVENSSRIMLVIFAFVNIALLAMKLRRDAPPAPLTVPMVIPLLGVLTCVALLLADLVRLRQRPGSGRAGALIRLGSVRGSVRQQHRHRHVLQDVPRRAAEDELPQPRVAPGAHDQKIGTVVGEARQDGVTDLDIGRDGRCDLAFHAVAGERGCNAGAGQVAGRIGLGLRVHPDDPDPVCGLQQRHGVEHGARRLPARVPGDGRTLADHGVAPDVGDDEHRPAALHDQPLRDVQHAGEIEARVTLAGDDEIGDPGALEDDVPDAVVARLHAHPFRNDRAASDGILEGLVHPVGLVLEGLQVGLDQPGTVRGHAVGRDGRHDVERGHVRFKLRAELAGGVDQAGDAALVVEVNEDCLVGHDRSPSPPRGRSRSDAAHCGISCFGR